MSSAVREVHPVILPPLPKLSPDEVPGWSDETLAALDKLSTTERAFVEWMATGLNNAEAYRKATGREYTDRETDTTKASAYRMLSRPRVQHARRLAMKDLNFDARMDRAWMLQRLELALERAEKESSPESVARIIDIIAKLKGEHLPPAPQEVNVRHHLSMTPAHQRFFETLEAARKRAGLAASKDNDG